MSVAVEQELEAKAGIIPQLPLHAQAFAADSGAVTAAMATAQPHSVSELVIQVPQVSTQAIPDNWVERMRKYIPAEVLVAWATTQQLLNSIFQGVVDTPREVTTFAVVWAGVAYAWRGLSSPRPN